MSTQWGCQSLPYQLEFASLHSAWYRSANADRSNLRGSKLRGVTAKVERCVAAGRGNQTAASTAAASMDRWSGGRQRTAKNKDIASLCRRLCDNHASIPTPVLVQVGFEYRIFKIEFEFEHIIRSSKIRILFNIPNTDDTRIYRDTKISRYWYRVCLVGSILFSTATLHKWQTF